MISTLIIVLFSEITLKIHFNILFVSFLLFVLLLLFCCYFTYHPVCNTVFRHCRHPTVNNLFQIIGASCSISITQNLKVEREFQVFSSVAVIKHRFWYCIINLQKYSSETKQLQICCVVKLQFLYFLITKKSKLISRKILRHFSVDSWIVVGVGWPGSVVGLHALVHHVSPALEQGECLWLVHLVSVVKVVVNAAVPADDWCVWEGSVLEDLLNRVHPEPVHSLVQPEVNHCLQEYAVTGCVAI